MVTVNIGGMPVTFSLEPDPLSPGHKALLVATTAETTQHIMVIGRGGFEGIGYINEGIPMVRRTTNRKGNIRMQYDGEDMEQVSEGIVEMEGVVVIDAQKAQEVH